MVLYNSTKKTTKVCRDMLLLDCLSLRQFRPRDVQHSAQAVFEVASIL